MAYRRNPRTPARGLRWIPVWCVCVAATCGDVGSRVVALGADEVVAASLDAVEFQKEIAPLFEQHCLACHSGETPKGGLSLTTREGLLRGGDEGPVLVPKDVAGSRLLAMVSGAKPRMPRGGPALAERDVAALRRWIEQGANWPEGVTLKPSAAPEDAWWSLRPLVRPAVPLTGVGHPVDAFVLTKLREKGLTPNPAADRRTLIRRAHFDLWGLPPTPEAVEAFVNDPAADDEVWSRLIDRLLDSPHYGERQARLWLDVAHYGDTHGYDKDKVRPNAWPYRDYVIRAFNADKPWSRLVEEQLAGDVVAPNTAEGITALGFLAAGPWDFVGQVELREETLDKKITRNLDRDDMVATTLNAFCSLTVQCARCHDHKFDPISQRDYYNLQAVFAAVDRADRVYEPDERVAAERLALQQRKGKLGEQRAMLEQKAREASSPELVDANRQIEALHQAGKQPAKVEFGYHSAISADQKAVKWVQVDLGSQRELGRLLFAGCHDTFNNIGAGFGFPVRYRIEVSDDPQFRAGVVTVLDRTQADQPNPGVRPQVLSLGGRAARYVRFTATKLAPRQNDFIFALGELTVFGPDGANLSANGIVSAADSIEALPRWSTKNLVDGYFYEGVPADKLGELARLNETRDRLYEAALDDATRQEWTRLEQESREVETRLSSLPPLGVVYAAATDFAPNGSFQPTRGKPRAVHVLQRGSESRPGAAAVPSGVAGVPGLSATFDLSAEHAESARRLALARWIVDLKNPLTWRSVVNRAWQAHFGRGLVETPNDFGRMGSSPTHPELLDWLAVEFRDHGQSLKKLHRLILTSATYRQSSAHDEQRAAIDGGNQYLWRMNRQRLDAEAVRDAALFVAGRLDTKQFGPGFRAFGFKDDHSPHYLYEEADPDDPAANRRSIYRFLVRSVPDPFMETLDCADPSQVVAKRNETLTPLQALAMLNNPFMVRMSEHFAARVQATAKTPSEQVELALRIAVGRVPTEAERVSLTTFAERRGLASVCRLLLNANEFTFVD
jgi:mono/diheme cytochrome c family protein